MSRISPATIFENIGISPSILPVSRLIVRSLGGAFPDGLSRTVIRSAGSFYRIPPPRDPALDLTFDCYGVDRLGNAEQGILGLTTSILGNWLNKTIVANRIGISLSISGTFVNAIVIVATPILITSGLRTAAFVFDGISYVPFASGVKANWVKWSNIGNLDFTIGKDNVAGERPLDWKGNVHAIKKLGTKVVVYGENGVSFLIPAGTAYGLDTIYRVGLKSKNAVAGDKTKHFFIDKVGQLWKVGESLEKFDYSEYLSTMNNNLVMSYDNLNNLLYICDGSVGYVYNPAAGSLGRCQPNITGIGSQGGMLYVTSPTEIIVDPFYICTDIYDFGTRANKTIFSLGFGIDLSVGLYSAIDYRKNITGVFATTPWYLVPGNGTVFITAFGREFRIRARTLTYSYFELDYIRINGVTHAN